MERKARTPHRTAGLLVTGLFCMSGALLAGCSGSGSHTTLGRGMLPGAPAQASLRHHRGTAASSGKIDHVVIIIQENRSFNNIFMGFPGALTSSTGLLCNGQSVPLHQTSLTVDYDVGHGVQDFLADYANPKLLCFNHERFLNPNPSRKPVPLFAYGYVPRSEVEPYWKMARAYTLGDEMFQSNIDASFTAHQYLIAGQAQSSVDIPNEQPWGCDAPPGQQVKTITQDRQFGPKQDVCFSYLTLADELDKAGLSWHFYAPATSPNPAPGSIWSAYDAIDQIRNGSDWGTDVISPESKILNDVQNGTLSNVTWVVPDLRNSDHSESGSKTGPAWVASVVDAVGTSQFWDSTAIFVIWDDWGGWYDPVRPKYVDYDGLGFRVGFIVISPYALQHHVAHAHFEFGSILKFAELNWGLAPLAPSDTRARTFGADVFNFNQAPTPFHRFGASDEARRFLTQPPSYRPPDDE